MFCIKIFDKVCFYHLDTRDIMFVHFASTQADRPEANAVNNQSESHKRPSTGLPPILLAVGSQQHVPVHSSSSSPPFSSTSTARSNPSTGPPSGRAADSHLSLLTAAGLENSSMETLRGPVSLASSPSISTATKDAVTQATLSSPARAPAPRLNALPSLPPLTTTFSQLKRVTESPSTASSSYSSFPPPDLTPTSSNAMQHAERQKAAALAFSGGVRLSPSVIVRAPPFPILPLPPTSPTAETPRAGRASRSFRSASMSDGIPSSSSGFGGESNAVGPSTEGRREGRRTAARLNSMPLLPMEGTSHEDEAEDDADHMLEDDMIAEEEDEDAEGDPRMSSESAGMGSASDDEDGSMEDDTPGSGSSKNAPVLSFIPKPKRDMSFSALLGRDVKGKDKELLPSRPGPGLATPKASQVTKRGEKNGEKERDYFNFLVSSPSMVSFSAGGSDSIGTSKDKGKDREGERDRAFEREVDSALKTPTAADFRSDAATPRWPAAADYSSTAMWREVRASEVGGGESLTTNGRGRRPSFYHQVSKSMVDLIHISKPSEDATDTKLASGASNLNSMGSADLASSDDRNSRERATPKYSTTESQSEQLHTHGNIFKHGNLIGDHTKETLRTVPGSGTQERDGAAISATASSRIGPSANATSAVQDAKQNGTSQASDPLSPLPPSTTTTTAAYNRSTTTTAASGSPSLRRQTSMPTFTSSGPPPPYPSFLLSSDNGPNAHQHPQLRRFGVPIPRDEEGREELPPYSNDIKLSAILPRKLEFAAPGKPARDRKWRRVHVVLEGTAFRVYNVPHTVAGVSAVTGWWESKVGVGDVAHGNGITASNDTRGVVVGNIGAREPKKRSKWEEELELRAQEDAEAQAQAQQGRASVTIERASMDSQSSGSHLPQQSKSKRQLTSLLHPNRSRISLNPSARSQPASPAASPLSTPRSSLQVVRPSADLSSSAEAALSASSTSISNMNSSSSIYGNISAASSTLISSSSSSAMSSSTQIASSSSQSSHSHSRSHFRLHHRRNDSSPMNGSSKDTPNANSREKDKDVPSIPDPNPKDLIREYSLQHAESGLASDYFKRKNVLRVRMEGEQFLLQARDVPEVVEWIEVRIAFNLA